MNNTTYNHSVAVGIDVAKATLSVCVRLQDGNEHALSIRNIEMDIKGKLLPLVEHCTGKVVMESTGHYHWLVALLLTDAGLDVRVVNPLLAKQYTSGNIRKVKTDPADASGLARMAHIADNLPPPFSLGPRALYVRKKLAMLHSMGKGLQILNASYASVKDAQTILGQEDSVAVTSIRSAIMELTKALKTLERECVRDAKRDVHTAEKTNLLVSIPGVSEFCAILALQWFQVTPNTDAKSWIAYAGLDVSSRESGTWQGVCKLTKRGNVFLRRRLYNAAWGAVMNNADFKAYYEKLRTTKKRAHVEALTIIARKIVRTMFTIIQTGEVYDQSKFMHRYLKDVPVQA